MTDVEPEWPSPLGLVVCEPLADEARRSAAQKSDAELAEMFAIAGEAHRAAAAREDGEGEADYWQVFRQAIAEEAAGRPDFGQGESQIEKSGSRRQRRRERKHLEALATARGSELVDDV